MLQPRQNVGFSLETGVLQGLWQAVPKAPCCEEILLYLLKALLGVVINIDDLRRIALWRVYLRLLKCGRDELFDIIQIVPMLLKLWENQSVVANENVSHLFTRESKKRLSAEQVKLFICPILTLFSRFFYWGFLKLKTSAWGEILRFYEL